MGKEGVREYCAWLEEQWDQFVEFMTDTKDFNGKTGKILEFFEHTLSYFIWITNFLLKENTIKISLARYKL